MPDMMTVAMPMFNASPIAWLALEGLCRQELVPCRWDLLVIEEENDAALGAKALYEYHTRLQSVGCVRCDHTGIGSWVPLFDKWRDLGSRMPDESIAFLLCAADDYARPFRLRDTYLAIKDGAEWYQTVRVPMYDIQRKKCVLWDNTGTENGADMAMSADCARRLAGASSLGKRGARAVDRHVQKACGAQKVVWHDADDSTLGLGTRGLNCISRGTRWVNRFPEIQLRDCVSDDIADRLESMANTPISAKV
jgi:hypothetical protein